MGPLLARHGFAALPPPGGDVIGQRPIAVHLDGFVAMGATIDRVGEHYQASAPEGLTGTRVFADYPSVSGTQNVMLAATLARGETTIVNAATEPEVQALAALLNAMGARIAGVGTQVITVEGVERLHGTTFALVPDRIEAGTFAIAAAMTGGDVELVDAPVGVMDAIITKLRATGATVEVREGSLRVAAGPCLRPVGFQALPYPGLATDLHAPMAALLTQAEGVSIIHERVFDNRMLYVDELRKMGAEIISTGSSPSSAGPRPCTAPVLARSTCAPARPCSLPASSPAARPSSTTSTTSIASTSSSTRSSAGSAPSSSGCSGHGLQVLVEHSRGHRSRHRQHPRLRAGTGNRRERALGGRTT